MHDNEQAIALYEKLGFIRWATFTVKRKNVINESLFTETPYDDDVLNPYARIITDEARRRGIGVEIIDAEGGFFRLTYGGRSVVCRESLTALTTAIAMSICDDKRVTRRIVEAGDVRVPQQISADDDQHTRAFVEKHNAVVVKPARGEQGKGVAVGLKCWDDVKSAINAAQKICNEVVVEEFVEGVDLRIIVIDYRVVAAAIRRPASVVGNGHARDKPPDRDDGFLGRTPTAPPALCLLAGRCDRRPAGQQQHTDTFAGLRRTLTVERHPGGGAVYIQPVPGTAVHASAWKSNPACLHKYNEKLLYMSL